MAAATIGIAPTNGIIGNVNNVMRALGVVTLWMLPAAVFTGVLIVLNADRLYAMMASVFATFQANVVSVTRYLRLLWGPVAEPDDILVVANPGQPFVIPNELSINPHQRDAVDYQRKFPPVEDYWSDSSDDNHNGFEE